MTRHDFDPGTVTPDGRRATKRTVFDPRTDGPWHGSCEGDALGGPVTILAYGNTTGGEGPRLHVHPYDEVFVVVAGAARFFVGDDIIDAVAGEDLARNLISEDEWTFFEGFIRAVRHPNGRKPADHRLVLDGNFLDRKDRCAMA